MIPFKRVLVLSILMLVLTGGMVPAAVTMAQVTSMPSTEGIDTNAVQVASGVLLEGGRVEPNKSFELRFQYARVEDIQESRSIIEESDPSYIPDLGPTQERIRQDVAVRYLDGPQQGEREVLVNIFQNQPRDMILEKGQKVVVQQNFTNGQFVEALIVDQSRTTQTWFFIIFFVVAVLLYGGRQGVSSILGFVATLGVLFLFMIPGIIAGWNPVLLAVISSVLITFLVHFFVGGFSAKSISSTIGTAGGTIVAGLLAALAAHWAHLSGLSSEDARNLFASIPTYDYNGIFLASIIIGSLGAVMDVGISIGSAIEEVREVSPNATFKQLYKAGVAVGKDVLGTMSNTLILAYIGTALPLILLLHSYNNLAMTFDYDFIVDEIVRSIAGSLGLLTAIPITAYIAALMIYKRGNPPAVKPKKVRKIVS